MAMEPVKVRDAKQVQGVSSIPLPPHVPTITDAQLDALLKRSQDARDVDAAFKEKERNGHLVTGKDVQELFSRAYDKKSGKPKTDCAVVVAYYAQHKPKLFAPDAVPHIVEFVEKADKAEFARLVADLEAFVQRLNQQRHEDERAAAIKQAREKD